MHPVCAGGTPETPAEPGAGPVLPAAVARLLRRPGLGAGDRVAGGGLVERARGPAAGVAGPRPGPLDDLADAAADRSGDAYGGLHLGSATAGRGRFGHRHDGGHRCDDAGSQRRVAEHCAPGHGRELRGVSDAAGRGLGYRDADAHGPGASGSHAKEERVEQGLDAPRRARVAVIPPRSICGSRFKSSRDGQRVTARALWFLSQSARMTGQNLDDCAMKKIPWALRLSGISRVHPGQAKWKSRMITIGR